MEVLGDLVLLPESASALPLPWWHRAPLGFLNGTHVYVGLAQSDRPVGDIVVSALDINKWDNILRVDCKHSEETGVIASLMEAVLPLNIALAETVTTETGKEHHATLFCEDKGTQKVKDAIPRIKNHLKQKGFLDISVEPYLSPTRPLILSSCETIIDHGWLRGIDFLKWIEQHHLPEQRRLIDTTRAVVSADTETRILRYVFPYKGAKTVTIRHADKPGALRQIFLAFVDCKLNILSALLRRGGQRAGGAELIAVCEHKPGEDQTGGFQKLSSRIGEIDQRFNAQCRIGEGRRAGDVIYFPLPLAQGLRPILVIRPGEAHDPQADACVRRICNALEQQGCRPLRPADSSGLAPLMERADAAVVLCLNEGQSPEQTFQLAHTLGFVEALYKPVLLLTPAGSVIPFQQLIRSRFATVSEFVPGDGVPNSLEAQLATWLGTIQHMG